MSIILFLALVAILTIAFYFRSKRVKSNKVNRLNYDSNMDAWMGMRREERDILEEKEKKISLKRKKVLLDQIRKEYKDLTQARDKS
jgi:hypothetical protein